MGHWVLMLLLACPLGCRAEDQARPQGLVLDSAEKSIQLEEIVLGAGCFWGVEKRFAALPGVIEAESGYAGGSGVPPTYAAITRPANRHNPDNHAEVVRVLFNSQLLPLKRLLQYYFEQHDPTSRNRQGNDIGSQYRSVIFTTAAHQHEIAQGVRGEYQTLLSAAGYGAIQTQIAPLSRFYPAEDYHQDYLAKNPNGYCPDHSTGVTFTQRPPPKPDNRLLLTGKQLVVIDAEFCPYCEKFKSDVVANYQGSIPITFRRADELDGLSIKTPTWATPTLLFIEDRVERFAIRGYVGPKDFYKALGYFKLGDSEAFNVAFAKGTDGRFCEQYERFKDTPDGVFVDKVSGARLFDTRDRFHSGTGWLAFTRPIPDAVIYREDNSLGMQRTEVRARVSDIHLGHVFNDGPNGQPRYCINATVLDFVPRRARP